MAEPALQDFIDQFWHLIEINMGCIVPTYLKYVLRVRGYDNASSIGTLTTSDIKQLQEFFRAKLENSLTTLSTADRKNFFHAFHNDSDVFEILPGHVKLLEKIVSYINSMIESHGPGYFDPRFEESFGKSIRKPDSKKGAKMRKNQVVALQTMSHFAQTSVVEMQNATIPVTTLLSEEMRVLPVDQAAFKNAEAGVSEAQADVDDQQSVVESLSSFDKFIMNERIHLIEIIRVWMKKHVQSFFEQYSDQLVPEILEAVMENSKYETDNEAQMGGKVVDENTDANELMVLVFKFCCPACGKKIRASQQPTKNGESTYFSLSNVERHWNIHAQENQPEKPKKIVKKSKKKSTKTRKLRSRATSEKEVFCDDVEFEILTDGETDDEGTEDFKIVPKRKSPSLHKN